MAKVLALADIQAYVAQVAKFYDVKKVLQEINYLVDMTKDN